MNLKQAFIENDSIRLKLSASDWKEAGVKRDAFSLITLTESVVFPDGKEVSVLLALAATSSAIHTSVAIPQIIALFELENSIQRLTECQEAKEVLAMVEESKNSPYLEGLDLES
ncbi:TPA: PTS sugar transporter subunit IIA [Streptococcus agalactiae]|nr:PTS sugar transporter subunit IIA [Streptococcus agalactiae]